LRGTPVYISSDVVIGSGIRRTVAARGLGIALEGNYK
jgi:hypothetical protein